MPIPENPQSRSEQYLNAIATGDNSGLPEYPQSRMEQYLEAIAQNGGGSSGGGVLAVHVDGSTGALDKTWQEINDAVESNTIVVSVATVKGAVTQSFGAGVWKDEGENLYGVNLNYETYVASSASGYPVLMG